MDEKDEETQSIINYDSKSTQRSIESESDKSQSNPSFSITPKELSNLMNLYKDRSDNYNDIKYFQKKRWNITFINLPKNRCKEWYFNFVFRKPFRAFWFK